MGPRRPGSATSGSSSQSPPSDAPSPHFSPASNNSTGLHPRSEDGDSSNSRSPSRPHLELSRSYSAGRGGCWTCRLRRKKCDEQRVGDSCKTCIRLNIDCLGWGARRPEWMRDKQQVQAYRAKITDKLRRENRIRGQPRQAYIQPQTPAVAPPTSNPRARPRSFAAVTPALDWSTPESVTSSRHQQQLLIPPQSISAPVSASGSPHIPGMPSLGTYPDPTLNALDFTLTTQQQSHTSGSDIPNIPYPLYSIDFDLQPQNSTLQFQQSLQQPELVMQPHQMDQISGETSELVLYFFEHVKARQFKFYGDATDITNVIYSIIVPEPRGAVANAICALASLHHTRMRQVAGYEPPDPNPEHSFSKFLYDQALFQLINSKHLLGRYSEADAIAALNLTSFGLFSDGWTDWSGTLQIAQDWMAESGLLTDENPRLFIANMGSGGTFAVKTTIWLDIFASITTMQSPRFMDLYHRLFGDDSGFSAPLRMEQVTGFSEDVLYAIAKISTLAHWKSRETTNGRLSVRELIRRGDAIEQALRRGEHETGNRNGIELDIAFTGDPLPARATESASAVQYPSEDIRRIIRKLFRETTILYLHTILSDPNPGVQEITAGVDTVIELMQQLPPSGLDQGLVFPICLAGCMTDNQGQRQYLISRIHDAGNIGNLFQTRTSMEAVWQRRDMLRQAGAPSWEIIDWREALRDIGSNLLLV